jgi:hypothetical protein
MLTGPFLFRETGSFLIIPMALASLGAGGWREWRKVLAAVACSVLLLYAVLAWQMASGKGALPLDGSGFNYANAYAPTAPPMTMARRIQALSANLSTNIAVLEQHASRNSNDVFYPTVVMCALALLATVRGIRWHPLGIRDGFALGSALLFATMMVVVTVFYTWVLYRGLRTLLFTFPFLAVSVAPSLVSLLERSTGRVETWFPRPVAFVPAAIFVSAVLGLGYRGSQELARNITPDHGARAVERMDSLDIDESGVLVAPFDLSLDYVLRHYPIRWSFIPANDATFELLAEKHQVNTVILLASDLEEGRRVSERAVNDAGMFRTGEFQHRLGGYDVTCVLFERPRRIAGRSRAADIARPPFRNVRPSDDR